jgi:hypothetical protein
VIRTTLILPASPDVVDAVIGVYNEYDILHELLKDAVGVGQTWKIDQSVSK